MAPATWCRTSPAQQPATAGVDMALMPLDQALQQLLQQADQLGPTPIETQPAETALGRILASPVIARQTLPPWPNSAMDGYAVRSAEVVPGQPLPVSQKVFAGQMPAALQPGTCARIFTGAPLPDGADAVEMQENVQLDSEGRALFAQVVSAGRFVRPAGEEAQPGQIKLEAGVRLGPVELAQAASLGITQLQVHRPLRVAVLSTGDELVEPGQKLGPGQIYNSNRVLLGQWLQRLGCEVLDLGCMPDDLQEIRSRLAVLDGMDLLLSSGGVSVGEADYLGQLLREEGEVGFWKLALKPGKPVTFGSYQDVPFMGLPGNPVSTLVTFAMLSRPYILRCMGVKDVTPKGFPVPVDFAVTEPGTRREFMRVGWRNGRAQQYDNQCSGILSSAAWADGLLEIPENTTCQPGDLLTFYPFSELLG